MTLQEVLSQWPSVVSCFAGSIAYKPVKQGVRKAVVALARAIVAHEDGDDVTAIADVKEAAQDVRPLFEQMVGRTHREGQPEAQVPAPAPGTVKAWQ